ncbi:plasmid replication, integration and excision activator [Phytoactinopolyspora halotolerans]|uniref:Plasmid replication, integration and excision activator n=1 Tax=Phytoactinopolyspora halotolerans TaxID=1981512 RepID=A0A6L9SAC6_9ACTN|nr:plasmid replication, integration and excision activator [Phytoactinopolyspora halotolerans]NEE02067.1 plasmid replication, integration and excision activator [Phytoactinopolyspora halotolerans]
MAINGAIPVEFDAVFPHGAYVIGEVTPEADFEQSTRENRVQKKDKTTGLPVWQVPVMDADPDARKGQRELTVKIAAEVQPVPPEQLAGTPFRPVEFTGLSVTPYVDTNGARPKQAYSLRATEMRKPSGGKAGNNGSGSQTKDAA